MQNPFPREKMSCQSHLCLKETLIPNPLRCLNAVHDLMPILAKQKMQAIIDETNDAIFKVFILHYKDTKGIWQIH